jgi:FKBP-type peptidyl-prolyl cis-trans isomerase
MKQGILIVIFVVLGAVIIAGGAWYVNSGALTGSVSATNTQDAAASSVTATQTTDAQTNASTTTSTKTSMNDLKIVDTTVGTGTVAANGETVTVNYIGKLDDGTTFDSSFSRNKPFSFVLGNNGPGGVIQGWNLGVLGMKVGGTRELTIPSDLGYGASGYPPVIPGNATLHFTITLLAVSSTATGQ